jgi:hypothetical protein
MPAMRAFFWLFITGSYELAKNYVKLKDRIGITNSFYTNKVKFNDIKSWNFRIWWLRSGGGEVA